MMPDVRLIDANALKRLIKSGDDLIFDHATECEILHMIDYQETIDAQPVKHGRWSECWRDPVRNVISVICSACGDASITHLPKRDLTVDDVPKKMCIQMPYCPKCCADMRGDADETP